MSYADRRNRAERRNRKHDGRFAPERKRFAPALFQVCDRCAETFKDGCLASHYDNDCKNPPRWWLEENPRKESARG